MKISLKLAYEILLNSTINIFEFDGDYRIGLTLSEPNGRDEHTFLQYKCYIYFLEKDNRLVEIDGNSLTFINSYGEEVNVTPLVTFNVAKSAMERAGCEYLPNLLPQVLTMPN